MLVNREFLEKIILNTPYYYSLCRQYVFSEGDEIFRSNYTESLY